MTLRPVSPQLLAERPGGPRLPTCTANRCAYSAQSFVELLGIIDPAVPDPWGAHNVAVTDLTAARKLVEADAIATSTALRVSTSPPTTPAACRSPSPRADPGRHEEGHDDHVSVPIA
ncbi:hypothetical protein AB0392_31310 [Nonomuraea angiospora]|uniref:hypothetical protein n=1 Tax=Nonomuraea angiospora TaxID=46172 RepID=UPI00344B3225